MLAPKRFGEPVRIGQMRAAIELIPQQGKGALEVGAANEHIEILCMVEDAGNRLQSKGAAYQVGNARQIEPSKRSAVKRMLFGLALAGSIAAHRFAFLGCQLRGRSRHDPAPQISAPMVAAAADSGCSMAISNRRNGGWLGKRRCSSGIATL